MLSAQDRHRPPRPHPHSSGRAGGSAASPSAAESEYDPFGAAHSSTSISAALGFAISNKLAGKPGRAIAVIGDGAMSAGMAYEAMNNAHEAGNRLIVILNDNDMSIAPPVGSLRNSLARLVSSGKYLGPAPAGAEAGTRNAGPDASLGAQVRGIYPRLGDRRHACSRSSASIMSARSTGIMSKRWSRCWRMSATPKKARSWSMP